MPWKVRTGSGFLQKSGVEVVYDTRQEALVIARAFNRRHSKGASYPAEVGTDGQLTPACQAAEDRAADYLSRTLPQRFYVSVVDAGRLGLLAGPFDTHAEALALVEPARDLANKANAWAHFYAFGTVGMSPTCDKPGLFNAELGL